MQTVANLQSVSSLKIEVKKKTSNTFIKYTYKFIPYYITFTLIRKLGFNEVLKSFFKLNSKLIFGCVNYNQKNVSKCLRLTKTTATSNTNSKIIPRNFKIALFCTQTLTKHAHTKANTVYSNVNIALCLAVIVYVYACCRWKLWAVIQGGLCVCTQWKSFKLTRWYTYSL